jgi:large subunit ribosomal protein L25
MVAPPATWKRSEVIMADMRTIAVEPRDRAGKGAARATRRTGRVPGVVYGEGQPPVMVSVDQKEIQREFRRTGFFARLCDVKMAEQTIRVLPREVQIDPVTDRPIHVDFLRVGAKTRVTVGVPVQFINDGTSPGIKRGGVLNVVRHEVELVCQADAIPDHLTVDLDGLDIGDSIHISMIKLPDGVRPTITGRDFTIASIAPPTVLQVETPAAAATTAEGEVAPAEGEAVAGAAPAADAADAAAKPAAGGKQAAPAAKGKGKGKEKG